MRSSKNKKHAAPGRTGRDRAVTYPCLRVMKLEDLAPAGYNPRTISPEALARLGKSMDESEGLGNLQPLTFNVRTQTLIAGHQRREIMLARGDLETPVWCVDLTIEKEKAANLALNNFAGEWDESALENLLFELQGLKVDLELTGFGADEIGRIALEAANEGTIKTVKALPPPSRTWFLIGFPTVKMPELQALMDQVAALPDAYIKSTVNDDNTKP